jgi:NTE family protein
MPQHRWAAGGYEGHRVSEDRVAFVLGGGGALGACEVGMLRALAERGVRPDVILGTSVGAVNGAVFAADPTVEGADRLAGLWTDGDETGVFGSSLLRQVATLARSGTHLQELEPLRRRLEETLAPVARIEDLPARFQCVAASIERAAEHWFQSGPIAEAVLASCAVPGILPPVRIGDEHFIDGGIVNSIPVGRAVALGARTVYVLQVGRLERPLHPPRWPWEVGLVAFEVARRHRFQYDMSNLPDDVDVHVLPTGGTAAPAFNDLAGQLRYRNFGGVDQRIEAAYEASMEYLVADTEAGGRR